MTLTSSLEILARSGEGSELETDDTPSAVVMAHKVGKKIGVKFKTYKVKRDDGKVRRAIVHAGFRG